MKVIPYMMFDGNCEEAMKFYAEVFGGEVGYMMRYSENADMPVSKAYGDKILHGDISIGKDLIYVSDTFEGQKVQFGNHMDININFDSVEQLDQAYDLLSKEAKKITMALGDTFWHAKFASLQDKYGYGWSLNYSYPEEK